MSDTLEITALIAVTGGARVYALKRPGVALKLYLDPRDRGRAVAEADLRTTSTALPRCLTMFELDGGVAMLLDGDPGLAAADLVRAAPAPDRAALELVVAAAVPLLTLEDSMMGWGALRPEDVSIAEDGTVCLIDPGSGPTPIEAPEPRTLTWSLGALLYSLVTSESFPDGKLAFARDRTIQRRLSKRGVSPEISGLLRRWLHGAPAMRPWPEEALVEASALAASLESEGLATWAARLPGRRADGLRGRVVDPSPAPDPAIEADPDATRTLTDVEVLFDDSSADDVPTELANDLEPSPPLLAASEEAPAEEVAEPAAEAPADEESDQESDEDSDESSEDDDTPADDNGPVALARALDEDTQPVGRLDGTDDEGEVVDEPSPQPSSDPPPTRSGRFWSLFGLR